MVMEEVMAHVFNHAIYFCKETVTKNHYILNINMHKISLEIEWYLLKQARN